MTTDIGIHDVLVENFVRLSPVMKSLRVWRRRYNGKYYYSCQIDLTKDHNVTMFTEDLDEVHPDLSHAEVEEELI